jgi:predicted lipoprotein
MKKKISIYICLASFALLFSQCDKKKEEEATPESSFDKSGMLANIGDNLIIPAYADFKISVDSLKLVTDVFISAPTASSLDNLQSSFFRCYSQFQWVSTYEFGPGETEFIRNSLNVFPCDTVEMNGKIAAGNTNFSTVADIDVKGFPALDFLLYGYHLNDAAILSLFTTDANAGNRKSYLNAIVAELKSKTDIVNTGWNASGGNYISTFKNNTGSDVGSSIGLLVNQLNFDLEILKNARIGIPLGKRSLGVALPEKSEAFYSGLSVELALQHINNIENIYLGRSRSNNDGPGFDDYLTHINARYGSGSLNEAIKSKLSSAKVKLTAIPGPLSSAVINNASVVDAAYLELQQLVILLKVDMTSALGVSITYVDNDGD